MEGLTVKVWYAPILKPPSTWKLHTCKHNPYNTTHSLPNSHNKPQRQNNPPHATTLQDWSRICSITLIRKKHQQHRRTKCLRTTISVSARPRLLGITGLVRSGILTFRRLEWVIYPRTKKIELLICLSWIVKVGWWIDEFVYWLYCWLELLWWTKYIQ